MQGAGASAKGYVLLHWPRGHWRVPRTDSAGMPAVLSEAMIAANERGLHVALVEGDDLAVSFNGVFVRTATPKEMAGYLGRVSKGAELEGELDKRITILCCTDGKRDPCCARYGFATFKALRSQADPEEFRILQSTHLGGCRFAASLMVLPQRARYGRLEPRDVPDFLSCLREGKPYLPAYRGNPELDDLGQVAEHAALSHWQNAGFDGKISLTRLSGFEGQNDRAEVLASANTGQLRIELQQSRFPVSTRCSNLKEDAPSDHADRWNVVSVTPLMP